MVPMAVVQIWEMRVLVAHGLVAVHVGMGFHNSAIMAVLVMFIVAVGVIMLQRIMFMLMLVAFGQVQPQPNGHQHGSNEQLQRQGFAKHDDGQQCAGEGCHRIVSTSARCAEMAQCQNEHHQTNANADEADSRRRGEKR